MNRADILNQQEIWKKKEILRLIYRDWYREIVAQMKQPDQGINVELGCGCGNFKEFFPRLICTDIFPNPWVDLVTSGLHLPFAAQSLDNLVLVDVLHHIQHPEGFFAQVQEVLKPRGRVVLVEPYISWASYPIYRFLHHEAVDMNQEIFSEGTRQLTPSADSDFANSALPTIIFERQWACFKQRFPHLRLVRKKFFSLWVYPLSGGFNYRSLIGLRVYRWLHRLEGLVEESMGRYLALRMMVVLEKKV